MSEWISVEERLPEVNEYGRSDFVWAHARGGDVFKGEYNIGDGKWYDVCNDEWMAGVTHWQPLPPPPGTPDAAPSEREAELQAIRDALDAEDAINLPAVAIGTMWQRRQLAEGLTSSVADGDVDPVILRLAHSIVDEETPPADAEREALRDALQEALPILEYVVRNGWDEAPPWGWPHDENYALDVVRAALQGIKPTPVGAVPGEAECDWTYDRDYDYWDTECGEAFALMSSRPQDNNMRYCPFCGKHLRARALRGGDE